ncbi:MAG TPA: C40 family peptidase [Gemmatimonadaceae bacterium]
MRALKANWLMRSAFRHIMALVTLMAMPGLARAQQGGGKVAAQKEHPKPFTALSTSALSLRDSIVALARAQVGKRYVLGGETPSRGFDCSGLVQYVTAALHIDLPRTARLQARTGDAIPADTSRLLPGDVLTFGRGKSASHVGIYVGDGRFVHASTSAGRVIETKLLRTPKRAIMPWRGARRLDLSSHTVSDTLELR